MKKGKVEQKDAYSKEFKAFLSTFLSIIGFILALLLWKKDKYVWFYAKISLVIFIIGAVCGVIGNILSVIPIIGTIIELALNLLILALWIISWVYALTGKEKEIPFVSDWAKKIII